MVNLPSIGFLLGHGVAVALVLSQCCLAAAAATDKGAPNFLLLFPDQWRYDWAGFNPDAAKLEVPTLQKLAAEGTRYTYAYTPAPWCVPARACIASVKRYGNRRGSAPNVVNGHDFPLDVATWYQSLQKVGYHTITVGKDDLTQSTRGTFPNGTRHAAELGFDSHYRMQDKFATFAFKQPWDQYGETLLNEKCGRNESGFTNLRQCNRWCYGVIASKKQGVGACCHDVAGGGWNCPGLDQVGPHQQLYVDNLVTSKAEALLDAVPEGKPWALHISFPGPHPPFIITEGMNKSMAADRSFPVSFDNNGVSHKEQRQIRRSYAAEIENLDQLFGRLLKKLEGMGAMKNTYVIVMSDHGEMLGDHNLFGKKVPWEASIRVPLIIHGPGVGQGDVVETPVSTLSAIDFILDKAGAQKQGDWYQVSLPTSDSEEHPPIESGLSTENRDFRLVIKRFNATHTIKLVCCPFGCPEGNSKVPSSAPEPQALAFNIAADPEERFNINNTAEALSLAAILEDSYLCFPDLGSSQGGAEPGIKDDIQDFQISNRVVGGPSVGRGSLHTLPAAAFVIASFAGFAAVAMSLYHRRSRVTFSVAGSHAGESAALESSVLLHADA